MGYIYKIINIINNKVYIGKTTISIEKRFKKHIFNAKKKINRYLYDSMNHYGYDKFRIELVEMCDDNIINKREIYWINVYKSNNKKFGYNMTNGGDGGKMSEESIEKMKKSRKYYKPTEETKRKISEANKGKGKDIAMKPEVRKKISETLKKKYRNGELKNTLQNNIIKSGRKLGFYSKHTNETKLKLSKARKGKKYEDFMTIERANDLKKIKRKNFTGKNNPKYVNINPDEILKHLLNGKTNIQIAEIFNVSPATIIEKFKKKYKLTPQNYIKNEEISNNTKD